MLFVLLQGCLVPAKSLLYMINNRRMDIMTDVVISVIKVMLVGLSRFVKPDSSIQFRDKFPINRILLLY